MSFNPKLNTGVTPFAQLSHNVDFNIMTARYNQSSVSWANEFTQGSNGYSFTGSGYIWGHISDPNTGAQEISALRLGSTSEPQTHWGRYENGSQTRVAMDDEFLSYGNSTELTVLNSYTGNTNFSCDIASRTNIIRIEL